jgi:hypothetical protein
MCVSSLRVICIFDEMRKWNSVPSFAYAVPHAVQMRMSMHGCGRVGGCFCELVEDWLRTGARYGRRARANAKVWIKIKVKVEVERSTNIVVFRGRLPESKKFGH